MPIVPRGRGRIHLDMPQPKPGVTESTESIQEPPVYISPKKLIPLSLKSVERQLSITEEPSSNENKNVSESDENLPLIQFKNALETSEIKSESFLKISAEFLDHTNTTDDRVTEWVEYVMKSCLESADLCITYSSYLQLLGHHHKFGKLIKTTTLTFLQERFEEGSTIFKDKPTEFNSSVTLHGQIFLRFQIKGKPLRVLAQPLLEYLLMICQNPNEENVKIIAEQVSLNGTALQSIVPETMTQLIVTVQRHLLDTTSDTLRTWWLLIVNLSFYGHPLSPEIIEIFSTTIGPHIIKGMIPPPEGSLHGEIPDEFTKKYAHTFTI